MKIISLTPAPHDHHALAIARGLEGIGYDSRLIMPGQSQLAQSSRRSRNVCLKPMIYPWVWQWRHRAKLPEADLYILHSYWHGLEVLRTGKPFIYMANDLYSTLNSWNDYLAHLQNKLIIQASARVTVSPELARRLPCHWDIVYNAASPRLDPIHRIRDHLGLQTEQLIVHVGVMKPDLAFSNITAALDRTPNLHLACIGIAEHSYFSHPRLHFIPYMSPDYIVNYIRGASAGLIMYKPSQNNSLALPSKLFQYFSAALPVIYPSHMGEVARLCLDGITCTGISYDIQSTESIRLAFQAIPLLRSQPNYPTESSENIKMAEIIKRVIWSTK